ncbi:MAG: delta-60 repeat domain-containing protein, partial [Rubrivivax sp.]|nr:delta-60 repeat domain-containing protein [Rubrivivax sp.]
DDGSVDTGFGSGGRVSNVLGGTFGDELFDITVQPDGRIVVVGTSRVDATSAFGYDFGVARFNADGTRDTAFGSGGIVRIDFIGLPDRATRVLVQPDGKLLVVGFATTAFDPKAGTDDSAFAVVRLNAGGSLDTGFGSGGRATVDVGGVIDFAYAAALQSDGRIVVAGRTSAGRSDEADLGVLRLNADGSPDPSFGARGTLVLDLSPTWDEAVDLAVQADGKVVVAVAWKDVGRFAYGLLRLHADGSRDAGFGDNGFVTTDIGANDDTARAMALQADGKIVVAGQASSSTVSDFGIARYLADGSPDTAFGNGGVLLVDFFGALDGANDMLIQPDGKVVVGGLTRNVNRSVTGLVRILP